MLTIYKFNLIQKVDFDFYIDIHIGAKILSVEVQYEKPVIYALVDTERQKERRYGTSIPTGGNIKEDNFLETHEFIGTTRYRGGDIVQHVFLEK
jgi:hypothetical protein